MVFIGNLPWQATVPVLEKLLATSGQVEKIDLTTDEMGRSKGFAQCKYKTISGTKQCIDELNGKNFHDKTLRIQYMV
jgi:RNA recognition motif-containing protein